MPDTATSLEAATCVAAVVDGRRSVLFGRPDGDPSSEQTLGSGATLQVWGALDPSAMPAVEGLIAKIQQTEASVAQLAGALVESNDQLVAVYDLAGLQTQSLDESEAVVNLLDEACRLLHCDGAVLSDGRARRFLSTSAGDTDWLDDCIASYLATGAPAITDDGAGTSALLVDVTGPDGGAFVLALARRRDGRFLTGDRRLAEAIADTLKGVLSTSALHHQALMRKEHDTAAKLAQSALPRHQPSCDGLDAVARTYPARAAGGDFFTYATEDDAFYFVVGDVSGKGLPAALVMSTLVSASNAAIRRYGQEGPWRVLKAIDDDAYDYLSDAGLFATMVVGTIRPECGTAEFVNAGHGPVMVSDSITTTNIDAVTPPVGVLPLMGPCEATTVLLGPEQLVVIGSDGLTEQENPEGEMFGEDTLAELLHSCSDMNANDTSDRVLHEVESYAGEAPQSDDRTVMVMRLVDHPENQTSVGDETEQESETT